MFTTTSRSAPASPEPGRPRHSHGNGQRGGQRQEEMETQADTRLQPLQDPQHLFHISSLHPSGLLVYPFPSAFPPSVTVGIESLRLRRIHQGHSSNHCLHPGLLEVAETLPQVLTRKNSSLGGFSQNTQTSSRPRLLLSDALSVWDCRRATPFTPPPWGVGMEVGEVEL